MDAPFSDDEIAEMDADDAGHIADQMRTINELALIAQNEDATKGELRSALADALSGWAEQVALIAG